ncbi:MULTISPECIES: hypothetical protein [unclassified Halobacteriovorax]|uniref:hypothetical protein n=1 Tax=unclassified Halobacteriovorax TaxID=2639665 RepID=UPI00399AF768
MNKTIEYLERLKATYDGASGYRMAKLLGISEAAIYKYRKELSFMDVNIAYRLAILIDEDPAKVIAETQLDHPQKPETEHLFRWVLEVSKTPGAPELPRVQTA